MKKLLLAAFIILSAYFTVSAQEENPYIDSLIRDAKTLTFSDPNKALKQADTIFSISNRLQYQAGIGEVYNIKGIVFFNWGLYDFALRSFITAIPYFESQKDSLRLSKIYNNLGVVSYNINKYQLSLYFFYISLEIQRRYAQWINYIDVLNNIGSLYEKLKMNKQSIAIHKKAIELSDSLDYEGGKSSAYNNIGVVYENSGFPDTAIFYYEKSILSKKKQPDIQLTLMYSNLARAYTKTGKLEEAKSYMDSALMYGEAHEAQAYLIAVYEQLSDYYYGRNDLQNAYKYMREHVKAKEKMDNQTTEGDFADFLMQNQRISYEKDKKLLQDKIRIQRNYRTALIAIIVILIMLSFFIFLFLRSRVNLMRQKQRVADIEHEKRLNEMAANEALARLEKEKLESEISLKERQLTTLTLSLASKNDLMLEIGNHLSAIDSNESDASRTDNLSKIKSIVHLNSNDEETWKSFFFHFEQVYPQFFDRLTTAFADLTSGEQKLCAYLMTNLNNKEIAKIMNISEASVKIKKNRLAKKINIDNAADIPKVLKSI